MLKTLRAFEILTRLSDKGILGKSILREINDDIKLFLDEENPRDIPDIKNSKV